MWWFFLVVVCTVINLCRLRPFCCLFFGACDIVLRSFQLQFCTQPPKKLCVLKILKLACYIQHIHIHIHMTTKQIAASAGGFLRFLHHPNVASGWPQPTKEWKAATSWGKEVISLGKTRFVVSGGTKTDDFSTKTGKILKDHEQKTLNRLIVKQDRFFLVQFFEQHENGFKQISRQWPSLYLRSDTNAQTSACGKYHSLRQHESLKATTSATRTATINCSFLFTNIIIIILTTIYFYISATSQKLLLLLLLRMLRSFPAGNKLDPIGPPVEE